MIEREALNSFYENGAEELRLQEGSVQHLEFLTATKYLEQYLPNGCSVLDSCAGTGAYSFYLADRGYQVTAGDLVAYNIQLIKQKQAEKPLLKQIYCGDALDLSRFAPGSFDASLCMGALYHLDDPALRKMIVLESLRVLRSNGLFVCTYMNRYAVILNNSSGSLDNLDEILAFAQKGNEGIFYASTPEEMTEMMADAGMEILCHVALDGMACYLHSTLGVLDNRGVQRWQTYHMSVCEVPSLLGSSYHNMIICQK